MRNILLRAQWYIVALLACLAAVVWFVTWESSPISRDTRPVRVIIPAGSNTRSIADVLLEKGLIRNGLVFRLTARVGGQQEHLKPGAYDFSRSMSLFEIIRKISSGDVAARWVTIPEGFTIRQIGRVLQKEEILGSEEFVRAATTEGLKYAGIVPVASERLEGYLFPDTYLFAPGSTTDDVLKTMLESFRQKVTRKMDGKVESSALISRFAASGQLATASKAGRDWYTVLTVASMIEREARVPKDRPLISAVIWNRLKKGMKLEIDATVLYAMQRHKSRLTYADLKVQSPYNTYFIQGLPAGPIANPGVSSIKAAINPAAVDYLYYVARRDGSHIFSRTLDEHNRAKARVRQGA